ncbi:MAG: DNA polymerase/3'-5' exonuclease PolX [Peptococcaceae bacterium]|nr:DNA polymerase/3'-5' exonuclease PolX [Peptococcaceae bacterium]
MHNVEIGFTFSQLADLKELAGENPFKIRAYRKAADILAGLDQPAGDLLAAGKLTDIPGIGRAIAAKVGELLATSRLRALQEAAARFPPGLIQVMELPGIGPKRARLLFDHLKVADTAELAAAAKAHKVRTVPGFGAKSEADILHNLAVLDGRKGTIRLSLARSLTAGLAGHLAVLPGVKRVIPAGPVRRWEELVNELNVVLLAADPAAVLAAVTVNPLVAGVTGQGGDFLIASTRWGVPLLVTAVAREGAFWAAVLWETGPRDHVERLAELAVDRGLRLDRRGLRRDGRLLEDAGEEDIYGALGLPFLPPEVRGDGREVAGALALGPPRLLEPGAIRGDLHVHSRYSDGQNSLAELVAAARALGYEYLAAADHSQSLKIARGLDPDTLAAKNTAIDELNAVNPDFHLLKAAEVDIRPDGSLDYPAEVLAGLDVVVASVHSRFNLPAAEMTERVVTAVKNEHVDILGHPTGRLLNSREPYALDLERVLEAAARHDTWLEVNASPERLDLSAAHIALAAEYGVGLAIDTDAHDLSQLNDMAYGVALARKAALEPAAVVNTLSTGELLHVLGRKSKKGS